MRRQAKTGFTILELMVSLSIIAVLMGLMLPALKGAHMRADAVKLLANQSESMRVLMSYTMDHQSAFPTFGIPRTQAGAMQWKGKEIDFRWWDQPQYWGLYLQSKGYNGWITLGDDAAPNAYELMDCPACGSGFSRHYLTATAYANPELFKDGAKDDRLTHFVQRMDSVAAPSDKIGLTYFAEFPGRRTIVTYFDGAARNTPIDDIAPGADLAFTAAVAYPGMRTRRGLLGRD